MELRLYREKQEDLGTAMTEEPQTCLAMRFANEVLWVDFEKRGIVCEISQGKDKTDNVSIKLPGMQAVELAEGQWLAIYDDATAPVEASGRFACVYTDAEFNELYEPAGGQPMQAVEGAAERSGGIS